MTDILTVEEFRPKSLKDIFGQYSAIKELKIWADAWQANNPIKKSCFLYGAPGLGKTTAAIALANDMGWQILELNSNLDIGSNKNKLDSNNLMKTLYHATHLSTIDSKLLIIIDEADGLKKTILNKISELVQTSINPVILIANDAYHVKRLNDYFKNESWLVNFRRFQDRQLKAIVNKISEQTGFKPTPYIDELITASHGDLRFVINNFSTYEPDLSYKDIDDNGIYSILPKVFAGNWDGQCTEDELRQINAYVQMYAYDFYNERINGYLIPEYLDLIDTQIKRTFILLPKEGNRAFRFNAYARSFLKMMPPHEKSTQITSSITVGNTTMHIGDFMRTNPVTNLSESVIGKYIHTSRSKARDLLNSKFRKIFTRWSDTNHDLYLNILNQIHNDEIRKKNELKSIRKQKNRKRINNSSLLDEIQKDASDAEDETEEIIKTATPPKNKEIKEEENMSGINKGLNKTLNIEKALANVKQVSISNKDDTVKPADSVKKKHPTLLDF